MYFKTLALLTVASAAAFPAMAESTRELSPVVVAASRVEQDVRHVGSSVSVVTREQLEQRGITQVYDALKMLPGITVSRNGGFGGTAVVRMRGSTQGQVRVMMDGILLNDPASIEGAYDFNNLMVGGIERIEVVRGAQSSLYGSDAIGGVINIITRKGSDGKARTAFIEGGSFNTVRGGVGLYDAGDRWNYGIDARYSQTQGFSHSSAGKERDGGNNTALNANIGYALTDTLTFSATGGYSRLSNEFDPGTLIDGDASQEKEMFLGQAGLQWQANESWQHQFTLQGTETRRTYDEPTGWSRYSGFHGTVLAAEYQSTLALAENQTLIAGLRSEKHSAKNTAVQLGSQNVQFDDHINNHAIFAEYIVTLAEDTTVTLGTRLDDHDIFGTHWTQRATISHHLTPWDVRLFASAASGFKAPTLYQLYSFIGNANLNPEESVSFDAGIEKYVLQDRLRLSVTGFHNRYNDLIDYNTATNSYFNIAKARTYGVESSAEFTLNDHWQLHTGYMWLRAEDRLTDSVLPRRPKHTLTFGATHRWDSGATLGGDVRVVSRQLDSGFANSYTGGFAVVDIYGTYPLSDNLELYGRVDNLFDNDYQEVLYYNAAGLSGYGGLRVRF